MGAMAVPPHRGRGPRLPPQERPHGRDDHYGNHIAFQNG